MVSNPNNNGQKGARKRRSLWLIVPVTLIVIGSWMLTTEIIDAPSYVYTLGVVAFVALAARIWTVPVEGKQQVKERADKRERWFVRLFVTGLLASIIFVHAFFFWSHHVSTNTLVDWPLLSAIVISLLTALAIVVVACFEQQNEKANKRGRPYFLVVGLSVFGAGIVFWTSLPWIVSKTLFSSGQPIRVFWEIHSEAYLQGVVLLGLAGLTAGLAFWRGQQTDEQIEQTNLQIGEAQRQADVALSQVEEAQRQNRNQSFDSAIQMALDKANLARSRVGWHLLHLWVSDEREGAEDRDRYLEMIRRTAYGVLFVDSEMRPTLIQELEDGRFRRSDANRANKEARQMALDLMVRHSQRGDEVEWVQASRCDLSDLILRQHMSPTRSGRGERLRIYAVFGYCVNMRVGRGMDLTGSNFSNARAMEARLVRVNLKESRLVSADLRDCHLGDSNLEESLLMRSDLRGASLRFPALSKSKERLVRFYKTRIDGADFTDIRGVPAEELKELLQGCWWDKKGFYGAPLLPDGVDPGDIPGTPEDTIPTGGKGWQESPSLPLPSPHTS